MNRELYSPDLEQRYQATISQDCIPLGINWPMACWGAGNAFLALLGPSMGAVDPGRAAEVGGTNRPRRYPMQMGRTVMDFEGLGRRKARWQRLCVDILGADRYVSAMTALLNLDWRNSSSEMAIHQADLSSGLTNYIWPLLQQLRPRIICVLSNRTWDTIYPEIEQCGAVALKLPFSLRDSHAIEPSRQPVVFHLPACEFQTLLVKPHRHPSRALSYEQISLIGRACQQFLQVT